MYLCRSLINRHPQEKLSIAEKFLYMLRRDYTQLEAVTLICYSCCKQRMVGGQ